MSNISVTGISWHEQVTFDKMMMMSHCTGPTRFKMDIYSARSQIDMLLHSDTLS